MSKKKKVSPVKNGKKKPDNKPAQKAAKPVALSKKAKKSAPPPPKKKSNIKAAGKKSAPAKKLIKKVVKVVQKVVKAVTKKHDNKPKAQGGPVKQVTKSGKPSSPPAKSIEIKNGTDKKLKSHIQVSQPEFKKEVKKPTAPAPAAEKNKKPEPATSKQGSDKKNSNEVLAI